MSTSGLHGSADQGCHSSRHLLGQAVAFLAQKDSCDDHKGDLRWGLNEKTREEDAKPTARAHLELRPAQPRSQPRPAPALLQLPHRTKDISDEKCTRAGLFIPWQCGLSPQEEDSQTPAIRLALG